MPFWPNNIMEVANATRDLSTFVAAANAAGLADTLRGDDGPITVFAPNNDAFENIKDTVEELLKPENVQKLRDVIFRQIVPNRYIPYEYIDEQGDELRTYRGPLIKVKRVGGIFGDVQVSSEFGEPFRTATMILLDSNIFASNGIVHTVDAVF